MDLGKSERVTPLLDAVSTYMDEAVLPAQEEFYSLLGSEGDRWQLTGRQSEILDALKAGARERGLWNFFLTGDQEYGSGLNTVEYAHLAEVTAKSPLGPEVFNCAAPDTGNMEVLEKYGTAAQQKEWLEPLLAGEIRSAFAMTEPDVASSDATNISTAAELVDGHWVINGEKFYISGAGDARCKIMITMVKTNPDAPRHQQQSQILVPLDTPGVEIVRPMHVYGMDDAPHGHMHIKFDNVRVPEENIILGAGRGFEISQGRLGPGRIHHCMRVLGIAEQALQLMCERLLSREAFGKPLAQLGGNADIVADARMQLDMARLLTLQTAWMMDNDDPRVARANISKIKVIVPNVALKIIDEAVQVFGGTGVSQDTPLAQMWTSVRTLRIADGPDAVHRRQVARAEFKKYS